MLNRFFIQISPIKKGITLISIVLSLSACSARKQTIDEELTPIKSHMAALEANQQELLYRLDALEQRILNLHSGARPAISSKIVHTQTASTPVKPSSATTTPVLPKASTEIRPELAKIPVETAPALSKTLIKPALAPSPDKEIATGKYRLIDPNKTKGTIDPVSVEKQSQKAVAPVQKPQSIAGKAQSTLEQDYTKALQNYKRHNYKTALDLFEAITRNYPNDTLAVNALYWMGECLYALQQDVDAIFTFKNIAGKNPNHPKAPDALLKTALSYRRLGDAQNTAAHIRILFEDYPSSPAARRAKQLGLYP